MDDIDNGTLRKSSQGSHLMVEGRGVCKSFGPLKVLRNIDFSVSTGEVHCIIGPSGSGKSTLLRCINQLEILDDGWLAVDGELVGHRLVGNKLRELSRRELALQRSSIGMVFQNFNLFPHMTAEENVAEGPRTVLKKRRAVTLNDARDLLELVGLSDKCRSYPAQLSGGQQQRVAIARAMSMNPKLLLFDEPTSALDPELVGEVLDTMKRLARENTTMVVVTHEIGFAREVGDVIAFMADGEIVESGAPAQVLKAPKSERTAHFLSQIL